MKSSYFVPLIESDPVEKTIASLADSLVDLFQISDVFSKSRGREITFEGKLLSDSEFAYDEIRRRFRQHGYTPLLQKDKGSDIVVAMEGLVEEGTKSNPLINILLLLITILTTLSAGAQLEVGYNWLDAVRSVVIACFPGGRESS